MLAGLFGNKTVEKTLLFLFVNRKCYGAQAQRILRIPSTSLKNALTRLEKGRIIASHIEGKTKIYRLNPAFPLLNELEQFLKKAYTLLSPEEKKVFSLLAQETIERRIQEPVLFSFWERLQTIKRLDVCAKSHSLNATGWNGKGKGDVLVVNGGNTSCIFQERGYWLEGPNQNVSFTNIFRWTLDRNARMISLEHLRLGPQAPVFLFHLAPKESHMLTSVDSHLCEEDSYLAHVYWDQHAIRLFWRVIGPSKNEEIEYLYS